MIKGNVSQFPPAVKRMRRRRSSGWIFASCAALLRRTSPHLVHLWTMIKPLRGSVSTRRKLMSISQNQFYYFLLPLQQPSHYSLLYASHPAVSLMKFNVISTSAPLDSVSKLSMSCPSIHTYILAFVIPLGISNNGFSKSSSVIVC